MNKEIVLLDEKFDYKNAFKREYCTLLNLSIATITINHLLLIDDEEKSIGFGDQKFYSVVYREWQNPNWYALKIANQEKPMYWTSFEKADDWLAKNLDRFALEHLTEKEAYKVATLSLQTNERIAARIASVIKR